MEENHSFSSIDNSPAAPYLNALGRACGVEINDHNVTHYSLPNYLAITAGVPFSKLGPYVGDCSPSACSVAPHDPSIFSELEGHGGWRAYAESMPHNCAKSDDGEYAPRHNPAVYYPDLGVTCKTFDQPLGSLTDSPFLKQLAIPATAPAFLYVAPNLCDDMHDCGVAQGDQWLSTWMPKILSSHAYRQGTTAIFITWDEGEPSVGGENCAAHRTDPSCHVLLVAVAPTIPRATRVAVLSTHYAVLRTIAQMLDVPAPGQARSAASLTGPFHL
jgi:hypothetical protein